MATFGLSEGLLGNHSRERSRPKVAAEDLSEATGATQAEGRRRTGAQRGPRAPRRDPRDPPGALRGALAAPKGPPKGNLKLNLSFKSQLKTQIEF